MDGKRKRSAAAISGAAVRWRFHWPASREVDCGGHRRAATGFLVRSPLLHRRGADAQVVEAFDGGGEEHGVRKAERLLDGEEKGRGK